MDTELLRLFRNIHNYTRQVQQVGSPGGKKSKQRIYKWDMDLLELR